MGVYGKLPNPPSHAQEYCELVLGLQPVPWPGPPHAGPPALPHPTLAQVHMCAQQAFPIYILPLKYGEYR
jgi:hypothetical protein